MPPLSALRDNPGVKIRHRHDAAAKCAHLEGRTSDATITFAVAHILSALSGPR